MPNLRDCVLFCLETRDASFKPVLSVQKSVSSVLEKIRQRKHELSKKYILKVSIILWKVLDSGITVVFMQDAAWESLRELHNSGKLISCKLHVK